MEPNVATVREVAEAKGCTRQAVYNAIERGELNTTKLGEALTVIFRDEALAAYEVPETGGRAHKRFRRKRSNS